MTIAVCLNCGARKVGAFNPCAECDYEPTDSRDMAEHLLASDHYCSSEELARASAIVKNGTRPRFPDEAVASVVSYMQTMRSEEGPLRRLGGKLTVAAVVLGLGLLLGALPYLFSRLF